MSCACEKHLRNCSQTTFCRGSVYAAQLRIPLCRAVSMFQQRLYEDFNLCLFFLPCGAPLTVYSTFLMYSLSCSLLIVSWMCFQPWRERHYCQQNWGLASVSTMNRDVLQVNFNWKTENKGNGICSSFRKKSLTPFSSFPLEGHLSKGIHNIALSI